MLEWERRLRPPMLFTYQQAWLGTITRLAEVDRAKRDAFEQRLVAEWPVMKMDMTKHVTDIAPPEVAADHCFSLSLSLSLSLSRARAPSLPPSLPLPLLLAG